MQLKKADAHAQKRTIADRAIEETATHTWTEE